MTRTVAVAPNPPHARTGFSLIELLITMSIVAILAAVAIPAYNSYVLRAHRTDAKTALLDMAGLEERYFTTQNVYSSAATDLGYAGFPINLGGSVTDFVIQQSDVNVTAATAPTQANPAGIPASFTITATAVGAQVADTTCASFTISSTGAQTTTPAANAATCWN